MPAFQPYGGKPAVRNDRGDRGNVGIIRSPNRASILPDLQKLPGRNIGDMKSGMVCDLADYVELTDLGKRWAERIT
jgi:hypothetical protein